LSIIERELLERWFGFRVEQERRSHVMVVFPNTPRRKHLINELKKVGLQPLAQSNAMDAIELLETDPDQKQLRIDLLVVYTNLGDLSGLDLARFVRSRPYEPHIILVGSTPNRSDAETAIEIGVTDYLAGAESNPAELATRAKRLWQDSLARRVRGMMIRDFRSAIEAHQGTRPELLDRLDEAFARYRNEVIRPGQILIADPDQQLRTALAAALTKEGVQAEQAPGGSTALVLLESEPIDVVVVDPAAMDMDEVAFYERAKAINPHVEVVLLAGQTTVDQALKALRFGVADIIRKPLEDPAVAARRMAGIIERHTRENHEGYIITALYQAVTKTIRPNPDNEELRNRVFEGMELLQAPPQPPPTPEEGPGGESQLRNDAVDAASGATTSATAPSNQDDQSTPTDKVQRIQTLELKSGEFEVVGNLPPPSPAGSPKTRSRHRLQTLELASGDYQILDASRMVPQAHEALPDVAVLEFIDQFLYADDSDHEAGGKPGLPGGRRRRLPRVERPFLVSFGLNGTDNTAVGYVKDLSLGGLFISTDAEIVPGTSIQLCLYIPSHDGLKRLSCQGRVAWTTVTDQDKLEINGPGFGVEFAVLSPDVSEFLRQTVTSEK